MGGRDYTTHNMHVLLCALSGPVNRITLLALLKADSIRIKAWISFPFHSIHMDLSTRPVVRSDTLNTIYVGHFMDERSQRRLHVQPRPHAPRGRAGNRGPAVVIVSCCVRPDTDHKQSESAHKLTLTTFPVAAFQMGYKCQSTDPGKWATVTV